MLFWYTLTCMLQVPQKGQRFIMMPGGFDGPISLRKETIYEYRYVSVDQQAL